MAWCRPLIIPQQQNVHFLMNRMHTTISGDSYHCTFCNVMSLLHFLIQFKASSFTPRTPYSYSYHCSLLDGPLSKDTSTIYGINYNSALNQLNNFHVVDQLPQDIMHILLEGVIPYELSLMLTSFITQKYFSSELLNDRIVCFPYSTQEAKNRPSPIRPQAFTSQNSSLNQSCKFCIILAYALMIEVIIF